MNEAILQKLMWVHGPIWPPVAHALAALPDGHPLKADALAQAEAAQEAVSEPPRLDDLEARIAALEGLNRP